MFHNHKKKLKTPWYKKVVFSNVEKIIIWSIYGFVFAFSMIIICHYYSDWKFMWENVDPFEVPPLIPRIFLSALAYIWPWALFYYLRIYQVLYHALPTELFVLIKAIIWFCFSVMIYIFIELFVNFLNFICSLFFNFFNFLVFIFPWFWISILLVLIWVLFYVRLKRKVEFEYKKEF